jgi:hypothetical protein
MLLMAERADVTCTEYKGAGYDRKHLVTKIVNESTGPRTTVMHFAKLLSFFNSSTVVDQEQQSRTIL